MQRGRKTTRRAWLAGCVCLLLAGVAAAAAEGTLVVAGGAVRADNAAVYGAFIGALPDADGRIAVISAASASPVGSAQDFATALGRYGVAADRIVHIELAVTDDDDTDFDERNWADNGSNAAEVAKLAGAAGIWFTGGDQRRITEVLLDDAGEATPMLAAIRALHAEGAAVGGTSAGAAIMSDPMITGGDPVTALLGPASGGEALTMDSGLGFFIPGLVDQHFDARARLGRVAVALRALQPARRIAIGVDENTAFVYTHGDALIAVVGAGNVTLVDGRNASWRRIGDAMAIKGLDVSVLSPGDRFSLADGGYRPADYLAPTVGNEYGDYGVVSGGGMALPTTSLARMLGTELLDNKGARVLERTSFILPHSANTSEAPGVLYRFTQTDASLGFWGYDADGESRYSVIGVQFDVVPLSVTIRPVSE